MLGAQKGIFDAFFCSPKKLKMEKLEKRMTLFATGIHWDRTSLGVLHVKRPDIGQLNTCIEQEAERQACDAFLGPIWEAQNAQRSIKRTLVWTFKKFGSIWTRKQAAKQQTYQAKAKLIEQKLKQQRRVCTIEIMAIKTKEQD